MLKHDNKLSQKAFLKVDEDVFDLVPAGFCMSARVIQWSNLIGWRTAWGHEALDGLATIEGGVAWQAAFFFAAGDSPLTEKYGPRRRRTEKNTYFIRKLYRDTVQMLVVYLSPCRSFAIGC